MHPFPFLVLLMDLGILAELYLECATIKGLIQRSNPER